MSIRLASPTLEAMEAGSATALLDEKNQFEEPEPRTTTWLIKPGLSILKPSIFGSRKPRVLDRTSYLNGLRGLACLFVVLHHSTELFYPSVRQGFLSSPQATNVLSMPIVRLWLSGHAMVDIFFVISGYVLSAKPLRLAREGRHVEAYKSIASSTLRRGPRIQIPCLVHTFIVACVMQLGLLGDRGLRKYYPLPSPVDEFGKWLRDSVVFLDPLSNGHPYEPHLWTMPHELQGSLIVFVTCLALAKSSARFRSLTLVAMSAYWLYMTRWHYFLFSAGMVCADVQLMLTPATPTLVDVETSTTVRKRPLLVRAGYHVGMFICLWVLSFPRWDEAADRTPGYATMVTLIPPSWRGEIHQSLWWLVITAPLLILTLDYAGPESCYQQFLTNNFCQYLGEISFSLYLCHGMFLNSFAISMVFSLCETLGINRALMQADYVAVLLLTAVTVLPLLMWHSEVFTRVVDKGAIRLAARMTKL